MICGFDITCHLWAWVSGWPWWVQLVAALSIALMLWGGVANLYRTLKAFGGWQAAVGGLGLLGAILAAVWPRKPVRPPQYDIPERDAAPPVRKPNPRTLKDLFGGMRR